MDSSPPKTIEPSPEEMKALLSPPTKVGGLFLAILTALGGVWAAAQLESFGYAFVFALPLSVGFLVGYYGFTKGIANYLSVAIIVISTAMGAVTGNLAGFFCTLVTAIIVITPALLGGALGSAWRDYHIRKRGESLGYRFPVALLFALPVALWAEATLTPRHDLETIETTRIVHMDPLDAWYAAAFYEDVPLERPLLLRVALPEPIGTQGRQYVEGAEVQCLYEDAQITKEMTSVRPGEVLAFDIIRQEGIEDRSAALRSGAFRFESLGAGKTKVTISSTFEPLLDARPVWRPVERLVCRTMHEFLLDGLQETCPAVPLRHRLLAHRSPSSPTPEPQDN